MSQSRQKSGRSKGKSKANSFVWTVDEVELPLKVTLTKKLLSNIKFLRPRKMSIGNHTRESTLIFWVFCSTVSFFICIKVYFRAPFSRVRLNSLWLHPFRKNLFSPSTPKHGNGVSKISTMEGVFETLGFRSVTVLNGYVWTKGQSAKLRGTGPECVCVCVCAWGGGGVTYLGV